MGPLERALSRKIYDQPPAELSAKLAMPAIEVTVTDVAGKKTDIQISAVSGDAIYGRTSAGPSIYEFDKLAFTEPNYKPSPANGSSPAARNRAEGYCPPAATYTWSAPISWTLGISVDTFTFWKPSLGLRLGEKGQRDIAHQKCACRLVQ